VIQGSPHIVYSGNIQGRDIGETGSRGCQVVTVDMARRPTVHFVPLDDVRWERLEVPLEGMDASSTVDDVVAAVVRRLESSIPEEGRLLACRVELTGVTPLHRRLKSRRGTVRDDILAVIDSQFDARICLEQVEVRTSDPDAVPAGPGPWPPRALTLLEEEFRRLEDLPFDTLLEEQADLRRLFDELRILDSLHPRRCESLQEADRLRAFVAESREVLGAEIGEAGERGGDEE
jgi:DNA repair exonuclease SbcCD nuclease subunit